MKVIQSTFEERCRAFYDGWIRLVGIDDDVLFPDFCDFVRSEVGRSASQRLDKSKALVMYFDNEQDRLDFIAVVRAEMASRGMGHDVQCKTI